MNKRQLILVVHNVRSCHNVGSLLRTADGLGVDKVYLTGCTPYPESKNDERMPHLRARTDAQINKTALGAQHSLDWEHKENIGTVLKDLKSQGFEVIALEQSDNSQELVDFKPTSKVALMVGNEVEGLNSEILNSCSAAIEIPMLGTKESFNVAIAAGMALYTLRWQP